MNATNSTDESEEPIRTRPGKHYPRGPHFDGEGTNFAIFSENATAVYLCLYDSENPGQETARIRLVERTEMIWHIYVEGIRPGQLYGYRVEGPHDPANGHYFNASKLLLDPYARAIHEPVVHNDAFLGYDFTSQAPNRYLTPNFIDSGPVAPKSVVIDAAFDWEGDTQLAIPSHKSIIYELHVKGFTQRHPTIPTHLRGSYAALAHPESIGYFQKLGITAIELMPVHQFTSESYWGYNSIGFFAPHNAYASSGMRGEQVTEFKEMVKALHKAGIEVILDVVYNHTAEGNRFGPTLLFRGIDSRTYYRVVESQPEYYMDYTGTGNTLDLTHPRVLQLVMDSLRYWVEEMHVDGFRFDLATALARNEHEAGRVSSFLDTVAQDPILARVKLIAEPWDIQAYQVGHFPVRWAEWNGRFRDCVRSFWKSDEGKAHEMTLRLLGSPDLYGNDGRSPTHSVNLITAHDGFTLNDLVSYNHKHNWANGEENRDGHNHNLSWNHGAEGPTNDRGIIELRERQKRNFLTTLFLSQGIPMLVMGDECGRTQHGNNNAYNQDNEINWFNWKWTKRQQHLFNFTARLIALRRDIPLLHRRRFYHHEEIIWLRSDGLPMSQADFHNPHTRCFGLLIDGSKVEEQAEDGSLIGVREDKPELLLWILNAYWEELSFHLPRIGLAGWEVVVDTASGQIFPKQAPIQGGSPYFIPARSSILLRGHQ
ncbi:glycogen debranching protein GlgX [Fibrisoma limi]|nr:glycogen debranching protein GlgX [Fibrisoma limi]